jgi:hypothetical protein
LLWPRYYEQIGDRFGPPFLPDAVALVFNDPAAGQEDDFNDWYTTQHVPHVCHGPASSRARGTV